jgi:putative ubiquitin-RnfH superfamily antitoxin RatB of RatAB toxin-antitoxin module
MWIEVALPDRADHTVRQVCLPAGATARDALRACGADAENVALGVFGRPIQADTPLRDGDRLEVYPPLRIDPKTARQRRALAAQKNRTGR